MPSQDQHRKKAENNRRFLDTISLDDFPDWVVVAAFYTAVHLVERFRASAGDGNSISHDDRMAYVHEKHAVIHTAYSQLQNASMIARYHSAAEFFGHFQPDDVRDVLVGRYLAQVEQYARETAAPKA